ncbi:LysM and putative peptidoglycan-binding domain-containing protein 1 [Oryzias melastigma]|uniref:LysM and putative peptidoglycan-binding domain-containing protein 1 n=1 Tax=Oryzias melastigma TaxID=30732 RepID=A0A3B3CH27_ORYME|nr:lysM and putative peptidoglycan-binding domain-containing protein 1 [Oryzias melastigma]KAF6736585.1 LysM and putative peptidoglycan-binding domain-containing protein 1 [Oryzias melastigma]
MSGQRACLPSGRGGLLRGTRTKSYGSLVRCSPSPPVRQRHVEHTVQSGDTLQGLALKYGVSMEQIKRANRLYTNDSIFLKKSLSIPVMSDLIDVQNGTSCSEKKEDDGKRPSDLKPLEFLKRLDEGINQTKQTAVRRCQDAEERVAALEAACSSRTSEWKPLTRSQSVTTPSRGQRSAAHGAVPLTVTTLSKRLRDREDEIFQL